MKIHRMLINFIKLDHTYGIVVVEQLQYTHTHTCGLASYIPDCNVCTSWAALWPYHTCQPGYKCRREATSSAQIRQRLVNSTASLRPSSTDFSHVVSASESCDQLPSPGTVEHCHAVQSNQTHWNDISLVTTTVKSLLTSLDAMSANLSNARSALSFDFVANKAKFSSTLTLCSALADFGLISLSSFSAVLTASWSSEELVHAEKDK